MSGFKWVLVVATLTLVILQAVAQQQQQPQQQQKQQSFESLTIFEAAQRMPELATSVHLLTHPAFQDIASLLGMKQSKQQPQTRQSPQQPQRYQDEAGWKFSTRERSPDFGARSGDRTSSDQRQSRDAPPLPRLDRMTAFFPTETAWSWLLDDYGVSPDQLHGKDMPPNFVDLVRAHILYHILPSELTAGAFGGEGNATVVFPRTLLDDPRFVNLAGSSGSANANSSAGGSVASSSSSPPMPSSGAAREQPGAPPVNTGSTDGSGNSSSNAQVIKISREGDTLLLYFGLEDAQPLERSAVSFGGQAGQQQMPEDEPDQEQQQRQSAADERPPFASLLHEMIMAVPPSVRVRLQRMMHEFVGTGVFSRSRPLGLFPASAMSSAEQQQQPQTVLQTSATSASNQTQSQPQSSTQPQQSRVSASSLRDRRPPVRAMFGVVIRTERCRNGVLHVIDRVIEIPRSLVRTVAGASANMTDFSKAAADADMLGKFNNQSAITIFWPTDRAWQRISESPPQQQQGGERRDRRSLLQSLVVPGIHYTTELRNGSTLSTLDGGQRSLTVSRSNITGNLLLNNATVIVPDVILQNGVLHVIDVPLGSINLRPCDNETCSGGARCCNVVDADPLSPRAVCYNPETHVCSSRGDFLCGKDAPLVCGRRCFSAAQYECHGGMTLCPVGTGLCAGACFDQVHFRCRNGVLQERQRSKAGQGKGQGKNQSALATQQPVRQSRLSRDQQESETELMPALLADPEMMMMGDDDDNHDAFGAGFDDDAGIVFEEL